MEWLQCFVNDLFDTDNNTSATIIITIIIFGIGQLFIWIAKTISESNKRSVVKKILFNIVTESGNSSKKQSIAYSGMSNKMRIERMGVSLEIIKRQFYHLQLINQLTFKECYESFFEGAHNTMSNIFFKKKKSKAFMKIWEILNSIDFWERKAFNDAEEVAKELNRMNKERNIALKECKRFIDNLLLSLSSNGTNSKDLVEYATALDKISTEWQKKSGRTLPHIAHWNLVLKVRILNRKYIKKLPFINEANNYFLDASNSYENMRRLYKAKRTQFHIYSSSFKYYNKALKIALKMIN